MDEFKKRIRDLRLDADMTPSKLGATMDKSEGAVRSWETGKAKPDADTLIKLAKYFDCSTDYLLGLDEAKNPKHAKKLQGYNEKIEKAIRLFESGRRLKHIDRTWLDFFIEMLESNVLAAILLSLGDYVDYDESDNINLVRDYIKNQKSTPEKVLDFHLFEAQHTLEEFFKEQRDLFKDDREKDCSSADK